MKKGLLAAFGAASIAAASLSAPASAGKPAPPPPPPAPNCQLSDFAGATACTGWFAGNLLNNPNVAAQQAALATIGFNWDGNWSAINLTKVNPTGGNVYNFAALLNGDTWIGIHKGKANGASDYGAGFEGTAFYRLSAANLDFITFNLQGGSSAVLYQTADVPGVPEPGTWLLMLLGFASIGYGMRRKGALRPQLTAA